MANWMAAMKKPGALSKQAKKSGESMLEDDDMDSKPSGKMKLRPKGFFGKKMSGDSGKKC